jgi:hypothetical protein
MTHDYAVRTVVKLVPEIEKRGAEVVLRDHAVKEDLPPAQLEKLAQVFNTLRTVSHIDKSADRGSSVDLVDVPSLVVGYALDMGHEKKALSPSGEQTHAPSQVDLMSAMRAEIAGPKPVRERTKEAASPAKKIAATDIRDAALELAAEARLDMSKLAHDILNGVPFADGYYDLSGIERDAIHVLGTDLIKRSCDWLDQSVKLSRKQSIRHDYTAPLVKQAFAVGSALSASLVALAEAFSTYELMEKLAANPIGAFDQPETSATPRTPDEIAADAGDLTPEELIALVDEVRVQGFDIEPEIPEEGDEAPRRASPSSGGGSGGGPPNNPPKTTTAPHKDPKPSGGTAGKIWGTATAPVRAVGDVAINASNKVNDLLNSVTTKERTNKAQRSTDLSVEDVRRAINIRRMIGTDAVLKEADPREVLEIYNSVARLNPEIANNMPAMKLLLREAVSYEGLTLDASKQLTDIRKGTGESEAKEYDNDKRRYTAGGALPLGGQSRKA